MPPANAGDLAGGSPQTRGVWGAGALQDSAPIPFKTGATLENWTITWRVQGSCEEWGRRRNGARDLGMPGFRGVRERGGQVIRRESALKAPINHKCITPPDLDRNLHKTIDLQKKATIRTLPRIPRDRSQDKNKSGL